MQIELHPYVATEVWEPDPKRLGYLKHTYTKTIREVYEEIRSIIGEFPEGCDDYFVISTGLVDPNEPWPRGQIAVYPVTGSSEGHYIHVQVMGGGNFANTEPGTYKWIFTGKTFDGWDAAWAFSKRLAAMLDEMHPHQEGTG